MMKASTQLIDDLAGVGLPSDEPGIFNFVINDHTIAVFWKPLAFYGQPMVMAQKSGAAICALVSTRTLGVTEDAAKEEHGLRANIQAIFCRRRHQPKRPQLAKIGPGRPAPAMAVSAIFWTIDV